MEQVPQGNPGPRSYIGFGRGRGRVRSRGVAVSSQLPNLALEVSSMSISGTPEDNVVSGLSLTGSMGGVRGSELPVGGFPSYPTTDGLGAASLGCEHSAELERGTVAKIKTTQNPVPIIDNFILSIEDDDKSVPKTKRKMILTGFTLFLHERRQQPDVQEMLVKYEMKKVKALLAKMWSAVPKKIFTKYAKEAAAKNAEMLKDEDGRQKVNAEMKETVDFIRLLIAE